MNQDRSQTPYLYFFETSESFHPVIEMIKSKDFIRWGTWAPA